MQLVVPVKNIPELDSVFVPAVLWNRAFKKAVEECGEGISTSVALVRRDETVSIFRTVLFPHKPPYIELNRKYIERLVKFLLWQKGGYKILVSGEPVIADLLNAIYSSAGERAFDYNFMGEKIYGLRMEIQHCSDADMPESKEMAQPLGRHLDGCRIGFDLGGSDRKSAAVIDGEVVFSEEIKWNPYFEKNPSYHVEGINDSIKRAAEKMPRLDAIGGSAAGVYVNNEIRAASLFRGLSEDDFKEHIQGLFFELKKRWDNVPFEVVNDGEVTALAGSMSMNDNAVLGVSMGTSQAAGYVTPKGNITSWLNELAFVPVDYRDNAPVDEWSGDIGCGVQYFSQQGVARLAVSAGMKFSEDIPLAERLVEVQNMMKSGDKRAERIFSTIGTYFGYTIAHYADFYDFRNLLFLGRVTSGRGGEIIINKAEEVLKDEFPELNEKIRITTPDEKMKRHGQAIAAASLPSVH
jgi:predicted NBD/HSP70 family sugar kinase